MKVNRDYTLEIKVQENSYPVIYMNDIEVYGNDTKIEDNLLINTLTNNSVKSIDLKRGVDTTEMLTHSKGIHGYIELVNGSTIKINDTQIFGMNYTVLPRMEARPLYLWLCDTQHIEKSVQEILSILRERIDYLLDEIEKRCVNENYKEVE